MLTFGVLLFVVVAIVASRRAGTRSIALEKRIVSIENALGQQQAHRARIEALEKRLDNLRQAPGSAEATPERTDAEIPAPKTEAPLSPVSVSGPSPRDPSLATPAFSPGQGTSENAEQPAGGPIEPVPATAKGASIEDRLGARWSVWVGGLALALGGLFLVRYSIEQGFIGPGVRILLGTLFSAFLLYAGERMRRHDRMAQIAGIPAAHIPGVLTAAGTVASFGTVYAAHALYGFIGPGTAFVAMGLIGIATMLASALHGPALAGLGLIGAFVVPLLVNSREPSPWPVVIYLAVVVASAYGLARLRAWVWLAFSAAAGALLWSFSIMALSQAGSPAPERWHLLLQTILVLGLLSKKDRFISFLHVDPIVNPILGGLALSTIAWLAWHMGPDLSLVAGMACLLLAASLWRPSLAPASVIAAGLILAALELWPAEAPIVYPLDAWAGLLAFPRDAARFTGSVSAAAFALTLTGSWGTAFPDRREVSQIACLAGAGIAGPLAILALGFARLTIAPVSPTFAAAAGGLAAVFVLLLVRLERGAPDAKDVRIVTAEESYAAGAIAALALGLTFLLSRGWLTVALAIAAWGTAYVTTRRPYQTLRWAVAVFGGLVLVRLAIDPRLVGSDVGTLPVFNWLLWGYGVPAIAFAMAAHHLNAARPGDRVAALSQSLSVTLLALLVFLELRHALNQGQIYSQRFDHIEAGLQSTAGLGLALVLCRLDLGRANPVFRFGSLILGTGSLIGAVIGLGLAADPLFAGDAILGGSLFNSLLPAYLLPAAMAALLARQARSSRPKWFVIGSGAVSLFLVFMYVTLEIRRLFHGEHIGFALGTSSPESWAYSAAWLVLGVVALLYGLSQKSVAARAGSAILILTSITKVFLFDLSVMDGIWRALSFIGLGAVLIGIGMHYQHLNRRATSTTAAAGAPAGQA